MSCESLSSEQVCHESVPLRLFGKSLELAGKSDLLSVRTKKGSYNLVRTPKDRGT